MCIERETAPAGDRRGLDDVRFAGEHVGNSQKNSSTQGYNSRYSQTPFDRFVHSAGNGDWRNCEVYIRAKLRLPLWESGPFKDDHKATKADDSIHETRHCDGKRTFATIQEAKASAPGVPDEPTVREILAGDRGQ